MFGLFGRSDAPCETYDSDRLGMDKYAKALAHFIQNCQSPMTIGIQGEWGSGKTTLMRMVRDILEKRPQENKLSLYVYAFETWQYGAMGDDESLGLQLIGNLTNVIALKHQDSGAIIKCANVLAKMTGALIHSVSVSAANSMLDGLGDRLNEKLKSPESNRVVDLGELRKTFETLVDEVAKADKKNDKQSRFVIFVDDLDRIRPVQAVSLLEILKNFLDVEHCVFVVACDYEVVRMGVEKKLGIRDEKKALAFFHKIVQVPFNMPVASYEINAMLEDFLNEKLKEVKNEKADYTGKTLAANLAPLIVIATGSNPRAFKRFLNMLDLITCIERSDKSSNPTLWMTAEKCVGLLGLVALKTRWPSVAEYLEQRKTKKDLAASIEMLRKLASRTDSKGPEGEIPDPEFEIALDRYFVSESGQWMDHPEVEPLFAFILLFQSILDTSKDGKVTDSEVATLFDWAKLLSVAGLKSQPIEVLEDQGSVDEFQSAWKKKGPFHEFIASLTSFLWNRRKELPNMTIGRTRDRFLVVLRCPDGRWSILSFMVDNDGASVRLNAAPEAARGWKLGPVGKVGETFVQQSKRLGFKWVQHGATGWRLDLNERLPEEANRRDLEDLLLKTLKDMGSYVKNSAVGKGDA